jgi:hypothetical protein
MKNASGKYLEVDIYFNGTVNNIIEQLQTYKIKYSDYDYLEIEHSTYDGNSYCLVGYIHG